MRKSPHDCNDSNVCPPLQKGGQLLHRVINGGGILILLLGLASCAKNYVTRHHELHLISEKTEIEIGRKAKEEIVKEYGAYHDLEWQVYLDQVGQRMARASDRPNLAYDFTIIDTDMLNAFAVPGGYVFVTRGILTQMADEAELAIVLGHEITHIAAWHGIESLQRAGMMSTLTAIGAIGGIALGAGEAAIAIAQAAGIYENLYLLGYGRKHELEADQYGIFYASRAGYDPEAALTFFQRLQKIEKEEEVAEHISPYWRDHPATSERLRMARKWIDVSEKERTSLAYNRDKFLSMVERLPRGMPAEKGEVVGQKYTNKPFGITLEVPDGWKLDTTPMQSLVAFKGPASEVSGNLQRVRLPHAIGVQEFSRQMAKQWGLSEVLSRDVDYPAGHGLLWQYGGDYMRYRTLLLVRGNAGYALACQIPTEQFYQYLVDCERIMRSLQIQ
jgi:predicted Zn-dependent protease